MVVVYVEGAAPGKAARAQAREAFKELMGKCGCAKNKFRFEPCGSRKPAYDDFVHSLSTNRANTYSMLLVDSEDAVSAAHTKAPDGGWQHLQQREPWGQRPQGCADDQCQLMATCMETWIMSDQATLNRLFRDCLRAGRLMAIHQLENQHRHRVHDALVEATEHCRRNKGFRKGERSFEVVAELEPLALRQLPHFVKFETALKAAIVAHP
ncbi:MAG TPA: DUF4276 family protein [Flavobacteriales bacterium]|nr:DUF4276 family protein [Flavobacteriales bacterium]